MVDRTWIGGGNNKASNPADWSPSGAPQPGDALSVVQTFDSVSPVTMNVSGNDLAGDTLSVNSTSQPFTAILSSHANMTAAMLFSSATFNVSQASDLTLSVARANAIINISQGSTLRLSGGATINVSDHDTMTLASDTSPFAATTVNLDSHATWMGTFSTGGSNVVRVNGGMVNNNGHSIVNSTSTVKIDADLIGNGSIEVVGNGFPLAGSLELNRAVGPQQSISDSGRVQIDQPNQFAATITLHGTTEPNPFIEAPPEIDLVGLANSDSYTFKNDMLNIFSSNKVIDTLKLHDSTANWFVVQQTSGSVNVLAITDPSNPPVGLPIHMG